MRALLVTPSVVGSGEAVTCSYIARDIIVNGGEVAFLSSKTTASVLSPEHRSRLVELTTDLRENQHRWREIVDTFRPTVIVFADYPLLGLGDAAPPLADPPWVESLADVKASLTTLDHVGYCQRPQLVFFGPPHRSQASAPTGTLPDDMEVLLPCPINEPGPVTGRTGTPFRYLAVADELPSDRRDDVRRRYLAPGTDTLVLHAAPVWSEHIATQLGVRLFDQWPRLIDAHLAGFADRTTVISVNRGGLLPTDRSRARIVNQPALCPDEFDRLLRSCDLFVTENKISSTLARASFGPSRSAHLSNPSRIGEIYDWPPSALRSIALEMESDNPGSVYPWDVFPIWSADDLDELGVFRENSYRETFESIPMFGRRGEGGALADALSDGTRRSSSSMPRATYRDRVAELPSAARVLDAVS